MFTAVSRRTDILCKLAKTVFKLRLYSDLQFKNIKQN